MFLWYWSSTVCYAYLEDVKATSTTQRRFHAASEPELHPEPDSESGSDSKPPGSELGLDWVPSRWYSRGWTLQELMAPLKVEFYNRCWTKIGTKWGLRREISSITGISEADLVVFYPRRSSIAQKMSWALERYTTRVEDEAYSLLGLFGVHMSLLYGEGKNAFRRLQEELIRTSTDHTLFAWRGRDHHPQWNTLLADSPMGFHMCGSTVSRAWTELGYELDRRATKSTYAITNGGLEMELWVLCDVDAVKYHLRDTGLPERDFSKFIIGLFDYEDTSLPGLRMGLALKAEGAGRFRVRGQPIPLETDTIELEIKTVVLALDRPGGAVPLRREFPVADIDGSPSGDAARYRARIFAAKELALNSVRRVSCPDVPESAAASFAKPGRDQISSENSTKVAVTAEGFYWFQVLEGHPFDSLALDLSTGPTCSISLQLLLSPAPKYLDSSSTTGHFSPRMLTGLTCRVWETGTGACGGSSPIEGEHDEGHTSYWRKLGWRLGEDGVWIEHKLPDGRTLEVSVVDTRTEATRTTFWGEILYIGLKGA